MQINLVQKKDDHLHNHDFSSLLKELYLQVYSLISSAEYKNNIVLLFFVFKTSIKVVIIENK